jgi:hypothetical protein
MLLARKRKGSDDVGDADAPGYEGWAPVQHLVLEPPDGVIFRVAWKDQAPAESAAQRLHRRTRWSHAADESGILGANGHRDLPDIR